MIKTKYVEVKEERREKGKKKAKKKTLTYIQTHTQRDTDTHKNLPDCRVLYPRWVMKKK